MRSIIFLVLCTIANAFYAQNTTPLSVEFEDIYTGLSGPVGLYHCGDERLFILEKDAGQIEIIDTLGNYIGQFLDVDNLLSAGGERGLLGMAFDPNYISNGRFYINYTNTSGNTVIARYTVSANPNVANVSSAEILLTISQPYGNHNGGHIAFGPDGYLYIGMGDGGSAGDPGNRAQDLTSRLGKMLRIDVSGSSGYAIPEDNPFATVDNAQPEIWAYGLRNPWKFSFDRLTGDLWIADVGQNLWEEVNVVVGESLGGENYGWRCYEGNVTYQTSGCPSASELTFPVGVYAHGSPTNFCSITGGAVYRGTKYSAMQGKYFFTDYCDGKLYMLDGSIESGFSSTNLGAAGSAITAIQEDAAGELYIVMQTGTIRKIKDSCGIFNPTITVSDGALVSSEGASYWWFNNGAEVSGANQMTYTPSTAGLYSVHVSNGTCVRSSGDIPWIILGGVPGCTYAVATNYNPSASIDDGTCTFETASSCPGDLDGNGIITVVDLIEFLDVFGTICPD